MLGEGGSGSVYRARDTACGEIIALKQLRRANPEELARFKREFRALTELHHPNLVAVRELIAHRGQWFIAMDYIEGSSLLAHLRDSGPARTARELPLAHALPPFIDIARGLCALHDSGALHRDLKPENVRITREGRAVLLDFGLVTSVDPRLQSTHQQGLGTAAYMAPEQAGGMWVGPTTDWYAFGTCLFEALTGRLPYDGRSSFAILQQKQTLPAPRLSEQRAQVPPVLDELCAGLLALEPDHRPGGTEVLACLERLLPVSEVRARQLSDAPVASLPPALHFAGREVELAALDEELERARAGALRLVLIEGESGVGKTALLQRFLQRAQVHQDAPRMFSGRCYENESVPFKAFDTPAEQLARRLRELPEATSARLMPRRAALVPQLFPVLSQVEAIAQAPTRRSSTEPTARRLEALAAMAELWGRLAEEEPLVLAIDDLQWADADSFAMLRSLVEHSRTAPMPMLIVATTRARETQPEEAAHALTEVASHPCARSLRLDRLSQPEAEQLARALLGPRPEATIDVVARESRGHPMLLLELSHYALSREETASFTLTLQAALRARLASLPRPSRQLLEVIALAGRPQPASVLSFCLVREEAPEPGEPPTDLEARLRPLLGGKLVRRGRRQELSCAHDSIREITVALLAPERREQLHARLAEALSAEPDPTERGRHWEAAGQADRAADAYQEASQLALSGLAFTRAAGLCGRALSLIPPNDPRRTELLTRLGNALAYAGRSAEAADAFARAAEREQGETRLLLRSRVANQLLLSAQIDRGLAVARSVLGEVGVRLPLRVLPALLWFLWEQLRLGVVRLLRQRPHPRNRTLLALRVIRELHRSIPLVHTPAFVALTAQHLRLAASSDRLMDAAWSRSIEGWLRAVRGPLEQARPLLERSRQMGAELADRETQVAQALAEGSAQLLHWQLEEADACFERAHEWLSEEPRSRVSDLTFTRFQLGVVWYMRGRTRHLAECMGPWIAEARERSDHLGLYLLLGPGNGYVRHLMADDPDAALAELEAARRAMPQEPVDSTFAHVGYVLAVQTCFAYKGGREGLAWQEAHHHTQRGDATLGGGLMRQANALCRLMALAAVLEAESDENREPYVRQVRKQARMLLKSKNRPTRGMAELAMAQVDAYERRPDSALCRVRDARRTLGDQGGALSLHVQFIEGLIEGGESGRRKRERSMQELRAQGWQNPARALAVGVPLAEILSEDSRP